MQTSPPDFVDSFRRHLIREQRKAVLEVLASELDPDITIGEVIDAAEDLGWTEGIGDLCLADLAEALVEDQAGRAVEAVSAAAQAVSRDHEDEAEDDEDEAVDEDEEDEEDEEVAAPPIPKAKMASKKVAKAKKAAKAAPTKKAAKAPVKSAKKAAAAIPAAKKASKKAAKAPAKPAKKAPVVDDLGEDAMSMEQAAKALLPLIRKLKEATMQDLEEKTGMGRRKLRFHIGQLVKHGRLNRHGMGRGTYYTVAR